MEGGVEEVMNSDIHRLAQTPRRAIQELCLVITLARQ